jgi:hypothetical protein
VAVRETAPAGSGGERGRRGEREARRLEDGARRAFLEIEDGHLAIVQAQLDSVQGMGFWFDIAEFRLEME